AGLRGCPDWSPSEAMSSGGSAQSPDGRLSETEHDAQPLYSQALLQAHPGSPLSPRMPARRTTPRQHRPLPDPRGKENVPPGNASATEGKPPWRGGETGDEDARAPGRGSKPPSVTGGPQAAAAAGAGASSKVSTARSGVLSARVGQVLPPMLRGSQQNVV
ncbi:unnamed protein product, partial [Scytosiphon promiscuus]